MKDKVAFIINEMDDGQYAVQVTDDVGKAVVSFRNLHGRANDPPTRVTLITMNYKDKEFLIRAKNLPVQDVSKDELPDGVVLGKGPIWLDKEEDDASDTDS